MKRHTHQHTQGERAIFIVEPEYAYGDQIVWKGSLCPKLRCGSRLLQLAFVAPLLETRCCCTFA